MRTVRLVLERLTQWAQRTGSGYRGSNIYLFCIISFYMIIFPYFQSTQLNLFFAFVIYYLNKSVFRKKCSPKREIIDLLFVPFFLFFYYFVFTLHNSSWFTVLSSIRQNFISFKNLFFNIKVLFRLFIIQKRKNKEKIFFIRSNQDEESDGIIPRSVKDIFKYIQDTTTKQFVVKVDLFRYPQLGTRERERCSWTRTEFNELKLPVQIWSTDSMLMILGPNLMNLIWIAELLTDGWKNDGFKGIIRTGGSSATPQIN